MEQSVGEVVGMSIMPTKLVDHIADELKSCIGSHLLEEILE